MQDLYLEHISSIQQGLLFGNVKRNENVALNYNQMLVTLVETHVSLKYSIYLHMPKTL